MTGATVFEDAAPVFAALGDTQRLRLLARLSSEGPQSITSLAAGFPISRQAVTQHLEVLAVAGLVRGVRHGRERIWEMAPDRFEEAGRFLDQISKGWDSAIDRLRRYVEE